MNGVIVTGTDTGIGKTVAAAMLTLALDGVYYKPIQSGLDDETDTAAVRRMTVLTADRA
ncbi:MAG: AAA family ATPase, partial [Alphaproteobacteria bacterium]|nr:AAA family ATPase [Alphaproteobacteria bacterium]